MKSANVHRGKALSVVVLALALTFAAMPSGRDVLAGLAECCNIAEKLARIPLSLLDHKNCFSLDRLDPTCPQCM